MHKGYLLANFILLLSLPSVAALSLQAKARSSSSNFLHQSEKCIADLQFTRRTSLKTFASAALASLVSSPCIANAEDGTYTYSFESRNRNKNKNALIRDDIWYYSGQIPPRKIDLSNLPDGPKWNAWGTCADSAAGNSCTYVSFKQKIPAYSKYAFLISLGAREYVDLGSNLKKLQSRSEIADSDVASLLQYVNPVEATGMPSPIVDSQLKMVLFSTSVLTSPNYTGPPFELLIARFYINELNFATKEIAVALQERDISRANAAWEYGRDSWNSYYSIVNKAIVPKVGDKFALMS